MASHLAMRLGRLERAVMKGRGASPRVPLTEATTAQLDLLGEILKREPIPRLGDVRAELDGAGLHWLDTELPTTTQVTAERCTRDLATFMREGWAALEPATPLVWNWHLDAICQHVQALLEEWQRCRAEQRAHAWQNLILNVPPGTMKSRVLCVYAPAWMWLRCPDWRAVFVSTNPRVALRDSVYCRQLIESDWYTQTFTPSWRLGANLGRLHRLKDFALAPDQNAKSLFKNTRGGFRMAIGAKAKITGDRADALFVDDPNDAKLSQAKADRDSVNEWWDTAANSRVNDLRLSIRVVIQQRVHEDDLTGHLTSNPETAKKWNRLCLPMGYDPDLSALNLTVLGWKDPRSESGECLFPERFPEEVLAAERTTMGSAAFEAQYNQRPAPAGGLMFKPEWWRFWRHAWEPESTDEAIRARTVILPETFDDEALSVDCSFKKTDDSDYVASGHWCRKGAESYLMPDLVWDRMGFVGTVERVHAQRLAAPRVNAVFVEDKANGPAVIDVLKRDVPGVVPINPEGGKEARAAATSPQVEAGQVFLPLHAPWRDRYVHEHTQFPKGPHDDAVDQQSQVLLRWKTKIPRKRAPMMFLGPEGPSR